MTIPGLMGSNGGRILRTLLLTGTRPGTAGVGAQFLQDLIDAFPAGTFACYCPAAQPFAEGDQERLPTLQGSWDREHAYRLNWRGADAPIAHGVYLWNSLRHTSAVVEAGVRFAQEQRAEQLWAVLDTPLIFRVATAMADRLNVPLVATVWDPPEGILQIHGYDRFSRKRICRDFEAVLRRCVRVGVTSEAMRDDYAAFVPVERMTIQRQALPAPVDGTLPTEDWPSSEITIAFVGSLYGIREFQALISALDEARWAIAGREVRFVICGRSLQVKSSGPASVTYLGWRSINEVNAALRSATLGYVPYWFDSRYERSVQLCFPAKFTSYLSSDLPTLYHGPERSMPARFLKSYQVGVGCYSLEAKEIMAALYRLFESPRFEYVREARRARLEELNFENFIDRAVWLITGHWQHHANAPLSPSLAEGR